MNLWNFFFTLVIINPALMRLRTLVTASQCGNTGESNNYFNLVYGIQPENFGKDDDNATACTFWLPKTSIRSSTAQSCYSVSVLDGKTSTTTWNNSIVNHSEVMSFFSPDRELNLTLDSGLAGCGCSVTITSNDTYTVSGVEMTIFLSRQKGFIDYTFHVQGCAVAVNYTTRSSFTTEQTVFPVQVTTVSSGDSDDGAAIIIGIAIGVVVGIAASACVCIFLCAFCIYYVFCRPKAPQQAYYATGTVVAPATTGYGAASTHYTYNTAADVDSGHSKQGGYTKMSV